MWVWILLSMKDDQIFSAPTSGCALPVSACFRGWLRLFWWCHCPVWYCVFPLCETHLFGHVLYPDCYQIGKFWPTRHKKLLAFVLMTQKNAGWVDQGFSIRRFWAPLKQKETPLRLRFQVGAEPSWKKDGQTLPSRQKPLFSGGCFCFVVFLFTQRANARFCSCHLSKCDATLSPVLVSGRKSSKGGLVTRADSSKSASQHWDGSFVSVCFMVPWYCCHGRSCFFHMRRRT